jgi:hypothetical protein
MPHIGEDHGEPGRSRSWAIPLVEKVIRDAISDLRLKAAWLRQLLMEANQRIAVPGRVHRPSSKYQSPRQR